VSRNENEQQEREGARQEGEQPETQAADEQMASQLAKLREMQKSEDHLDKTMDEARDAVQAAHEADSMLPRDAQGYDAEEEGPQASG
jgi:hypothetical protein